MGVSSALVQLPFNITALPQFYIKRSLNNFFSGVDIQLGTRYWGLSLLVIVKCPNQITSNPAAKIWSEKGLVPDILCFTFS